MVFPKEVEDAKDIVDAPVEEGEVAIPAEGPPTSDVAGEDIPDVPRYRGSVRSYYGSSGGTTSVIYITSASIDEVLGFYEEKLPDNGWTTETLWRQVDEGMIAASKGKIRVTVECSPSIDYPNYTFVLIVKNLPPI